MITSTIYKLILTYYLFGHKAQGDQDISKGKRKWGWEKEKWCGNGNQLEVW